MEFDKAGWKAPEGLKDADFRAKVFRPVVFGSSKEMPTASMNGFTDSTGKTEFGSSYSGGSYVELVFANSRSSYACAERRQVGPLNCCSIGAD